MSAGLFPIAVVTAFGLCLVISRLGAETWVLAPFAVAWTAGVCALGVWLAKRSPPVVVKITAEGRNQATAMGLAPLLLLAVLAVVSRELLLIPVAVLWVAVAVAAWRGRGVVPEMLKELRTVLAVDEAVLGDGIGATRGAHPRLAALRLVVATNRRLLVLTSPRATERFVVLDSPYEDVSGFGFEWKQLGRIGELTLTTQPRDGAPPETHVIGSIAPANLLSIAQALQSHGVVPDDPEALSEAERGWAEAQLPGSRTHLLDRAAMSTRAFDRGLWLLMALSAAVIYLGALQAGLEIVVVLGALAVVCGYVSGTRASLAYLVPLNLLLAPGFFFMNAGELIGLMLMLSAVAAVGLWAGSALRGARGGGEAAPSAAHSRLREVVSGPSLIRISGMLLAGVVALVGVSALMGFDLTRVGLAVEEATARQVPVDGRSNLSGGYASITYTPAPDLKELVTDEDWGVGPNDGARWELRSSFTKGYNGISLAHYIFEPRLDNPAAIADLLETKDDEHSRVAGFRVPHSKREIAGRTAYVWTHGSRRGGWYYAAWFPRPVHSVRLECVAREQIERFKRLCAEARRSLRFR